MLISEIVLQIIVASLSLSLSLSPHPLSLLPVVMLVSVASNEVVHTLGSLRRVTSEGGAKGVVKTGMVVDPASSCLVLDGSLGFLQFYNPEKDTVQGLVGWTPRTMSEMMTMFFFSWQLEVVHRNMISRPFNTPLTPTTIDHVAFSPDGAWLAVVGIVTLLGTSHFPSHCPSHLCMSIIIWACVVCRQ